MASLFRSRRTFRVVLAGAFLTLFFLLLLPEYVVELLWMKALGYASVFWKILRLKAVLFVVAFVVVAGYLGGNLFYLVRQLPPLWASRWAREGEAPTIGEMRLTRGRLRVVAAVFAALVALAFAGSFAARWDTFVRFASGQAYGQVDPIFGQDLAFYMLRLPFIEALQSALVSLAFLTLLILGTVYFLMGEVEVHQGRVHVRPSVVRHLALNLMLLLTGWAWGFYLDRFGLLTSPGGVVYGASYTDVHVMLPALWVMVFASLALVGIVALNLRRYRFRLLAWSGAAYVLLLAGGLVLLPMLVQQVYVEPNELRLETPYLESNIALTREAYGLTAVEERSYPAETNLTAEEVQANEATIRNIRLWDPRLLLSTYKQIQEIRTYYEFYNVDIDRYTLGGDYRQVMISGRELAQTLPGRADSWVNRHLQYTHGYGSVLNLVAQQGSEGIPNLLLKNLPPETDFPELRVDEPAIYYGEGIPTYRIVNTEALELNYPRGDDNVYVHYDGTGGVLLGGFWRQLLFAWTFSDYNIVLSDYLTDGSRIQFWNRVQTRIRRVAPFLQLDGDPYLVLSDQRQYWVQDAYTTAPAFPYAEPADRAVLSERAELRRSAPFSYIRNSVKVVVDAYDGDVSFYVMDETDPVLGAYREAFPDLFQPLSALSDDLRSHLRYPQDLFEVQIEKYRRYHMRIPKVFYNNEDLWTRPQEQYAGEPRIMEPYYILTRLPGEERLEFMLMTPFTPEERDNMIGWMAAKSDFPDYGQLVVYELPKEKLIYGPSQVEARIDQDTEISRQLSLWDQRGSRVVRGNLIVVPVEESFLYVEPVYLIAEEGQIPQLSRVIVAYGERVAMARSLEGALADVLGMRLALFDEGTGEEQALPEAAPGEEAPGRAAVPPVLAQRTAAELEEARGLLQEARQALQRGDFAAFGEAFQALEEALEASDGTAAPDSLAPIGASANEEADTERRP